MTFYIAPATEAPPVVEVAAASNAPAAAVTEPASKATLCSRGYNAARSVAALKQFMEAFPQDECGRHALARQKIAAFEENERKAAKEQGDRQAQAKALVGLVVAYRQEYAHCVGGAEGKCQNVNYLFEVKGKIREVNVARQSVQLQVVEVTLLDVYKRQVFELLVTNDAIRAQIHNRTSEAEVRAAALASGMVCLLYTSRCV